MSRGRPGSLGIKEERGFATPAASASGVRRLHTAERPGVTERIARAADPPVNIPPRAASSGTAGTEQPPPPRTFTPSATAAARIAASTSRGGGLLGRLRRPDDVGKRLYVRAALVAWSLLNAYDALQALVLQGGGDWAWLPLLWRWVAVDMLGLAALYRLQVPKFRFGRGACALLALLLLAKDAVLFGGGIHSLSGGGSSSSSSKLGDNESVSKVKGRGDVYAVREGNRGVIRDGILGKSHISGSHTIKILPYSLAKLQPEYHSYCVDPVHRRSFQLPLLIKGSPPWEVSLEHIGFGGAPAVQRVDFSIKAAMGSDFEASTKFKRYTVELSKPGAYRLANISDARGVQGKVGVDTVVEVVECPKAEFHFAHSRARDLPAEFCLGETLRGVSARVQGVPPLTIHYVRNVDERDVPLAIEDIGENESPLSGAVRTFTAEDVATVASKSFIVALPDVELLTPSGGRPGAPRPFLKLLKVSDGRNHSTEMHLGDDRDKIEFEVHAKPTAEILGAKQSPRRHVRIDRQGKPLDSVELPIQLTGVPPFEMHFAFDGVRGDKISFNPQAHSASASAGSSKQQQQRLANTYRYVQQLTQPGVYSLVDLRDRSCEGTVDAAALRLEAIPLPELRLLKYAAVTAACFGEIGTEVELQLTGKAPWKVTLRREFLGKRSRAKKETVSQTVSISKPRHTLTFAPEVPGDYQYTFTGVSDANYAEGLVPEGADAQFSQQIHPQSSAQIAEASRQQLEHRCAGGGVATFDVEFSGEGPWDLVYALTYPDSTSPVVKTLVGVHEARATIASDKFDAGEVVLDLISVTDSNGCKKEILKTSAVYRIALSIPQVELVGRGGGGGSGGGSGSEFAVLENQTALVPLRLEGSAPFQVVLNGERVSVKSNVLAVRAPGAYSITGVRDAHCENVSFHPDAFQNFSVAVIPKPTIDFDKSVTKRRTSIPNAVENVASGRRLRLASVCPGGEDTAYFGLKLTGKNPWHLEYRVNGGDKVVKKFSQSYVKFPVDTTLPGRQTWEFLALGDENYDLSTMPIRLHAPLVVEQEVFGRPELQVTKHAEREDRCVGDAMQHPIGLKLSNGKAPYGLRYSLTSNDQIWENAVVSIDAEKHDFALPKTVFHETGKYTVRFLDLTDANGCLNNFEGHVYAKDIIVGDSAKLTPIFPLEHSCVGEDIVFALESRPPWTVTMSFNGTAERQEVSISDPKFTVRKDEPGELTVHKVCHKVGGCCSHPELRHTIHALPGARMSEGIDSMEDIREGDEASIVVSFTGTPPFSFSYIREITLVPGSEGATRKNLFMLNRKEEVEREIHKVADIEGYSYTIKTGLAGRFWITSVSDKFCKVVI